MRRARFAGAVDHGADQGRPSIREALSFDFRNPETADDASLSALRISPFDFAPFLLGGTHALVAATSLLQKPDGALSLAIDSPAVWIGLLLLLDIAAAVFMMLRSRLKLQPQNVIRALSAYVAASGLLWAAFGFTLLLHSGQEYEQAVFLAIGAGLTVRSILCVRSPPLAVTNLLVSVFMVAFLTSGALVALGFLLFSIMLVSYSVAETRSMICTGRRRLVLDAQARKAVHFVGEFESSGRGWFWETTAENTLSYVSQQLADDFGCEPSELLGRRFTDLMSVDANSDVGEEPRTLGFHLSARFPFADVVVRAASDKDIHWSLSGNPVFDDLGRFHGFRGIGTDLTEQRRNEQEITRLARFDSLTGLPNRAMMRQTLDEALRNAAHRRKGCALFLLDLDRFKNVNDTLGHPVGDALLREVAERLNMVMGEQGQIGRLGGDEFKAVLPGIVDIGHLESLARTLIEHVSRPYMIEGHKILIGASLGIAIGDPGRCSADSLVRDADLALYAAKADGRGKHKFFEPSMHSEATDRQLLENDLRQAIDRGELWVAYQPIVRAAGEDVCGFEALVRWDHPVRGSISPAKFIPLAEECGIIERIGQWVLETAVAEAANWPENVRIAINLSPIQFNNPTIVQSIEELLTKNRMRAERLELEITEGVFLSDSDATDITFAKLKDIGVRLALDDFGTGYSSLGYLKKAPFDKIKIDQSFVRGASSRNSRNSALIRAIVAMAESLGMDTCAEGVETHDDLHLIRELGCSQVQGFIFGRPVQASEARKLANVSALEADGFKCIREPRQRLMRRGVACIDDEPVEVRLRNISATGALIECSRPVASSSSITIDIVGVGPVIGTVRWTQAGKFGVQFSEPFDLSRLAPRDRTGRTTAQWTGQFGRAEGGKKVGNLK